MINLKVYFYTVKWRLFAATAAPATRALGGAISFELTAVAKCLQLGRALCEHTRIISQALLQGHRIAPRARLTLLPVRHGRAPVPDCQYQHSELAAGSPADRFYHD